MTAFVAVPAFKYPTLAGRLAGGQGMFTRSLTPGPAQESDRGGRRMPVLICCDGQPMPRPWLLDGGRNALQAIGLRRAFTQSPFENDHDF